MDMNKHSSKNIILIIMVLLIAATSIWLPGYLMQRSNSAEMFSMKDVPQDYYSGPSEAIIRNASKQLTSEQCFQLIIGTWESTVTEAKESDCNITEFGIRSVVMQRVENLRAKGLYPVRISSEYLQWYTWSAKPYRALDATFQTYAAIFWDVSFVKYDNSESHRFIITESGDILYAEINVNPEVDSSTVDLSEFTPRMPNCSYLFYYFGESNDTIYTTDKVRATEHGNKTTSYRIIKSSKEELEQMDNSSSSSYIPGFESFKPDELYTILQTSDHSTSEYYVSCNKTENSYRILLSPDTK
jgi:hypothetical protein